MPALGPSGALAPNDWGAAVNYDKWNDLYIPNEGLALHHGGGGDYSAARSPYTVTKEAAQLRSWEGYHLSKQWRGLAYGWAIGQSGTIYRARGWGIYGAHLGDIDGDGISNNREIIPVIWIASGSHHQMSTQAHEAIEELRVFIEEHNPAASYLWGHQEVQTNKATVCPGTGGMAYVVEHRNRQKPHTTPPEPPTDWTGELIMALPTLTRGDGYSSEGKSHLRPMVSRGQGLLLGNGYKDQDTADPEDASDGWFGPGTEAATKAFQKHAGEAVDGVIGPNTWTALLGQ